MRVRGHSWHILVATHVQEARRGSSEGAQHTGAGGASMEPPGNHSWACGLMPFSTPPRVSARPAGLQPVVSRGKGGDRWIGLEPKGEEKASGMGLGPK